MKIKAQSAAIGLLLILSLPVFAQTVIIIPNGEFQLAGNNGSKGGLTGTTLPGAIGSGPWSARSDGVSVDLAFPLPDISLLSPVVNIGGGDLTFSGLAGANAPGSFLSTQAEAFVSTGTSYAPHTTYTLEFGFSSTVPLSLGLFSSSGFGVALTSGGTATLPGVLVANSTDGFLLNVILLTETSRLGTLTYITPAIIPAGKIGIRFAFGEDVPLLAPNVLTNFNVDNVTLRSVPEPGSLLLTGLSGTAALVYHRRTR